MNDNAIEIMVKAVKIRLMQGEELENILKNYTKLSADDIDKIKERI